MQSHHRKPRSLGGLYSPRNISRVSAKKHAAYHLLFANSTPQQIAQILNETWVDPDYEFFVQKKSERKIMMEGI